MNTPKMFLVAIATSLFVTSCQDESIKSLEASTINQAQLIQPEEAFPGSNGSFKSLFYGEQKLEVQEYNNAYLLEGDILFPKEELTTNPDVTSSPAISDNTKSVGRPSKTWPNNTVFYEIDRNLENQRRVTDAIAHWEANTALRFIRRTNQEDYIRFTTGEGCSSFIGRIGGKQDLLLHPRCSTGNTIHEIGHAVGLWHEQSRVDRDNYIIINFENIEERAKRNFNTYEQSGRDGQELTSRLDLNSIMMYGSFFFSSNGEPTIVRRDGSTFEIQRDGLSFGDIAGINQLYPANNDICNGVSEFVSGRTYPVGSRVTYRGSLYERVVGGWTRIGECG